jgi:hypothetical protein
MPQTFKPAVVYLNLLRAEFNSSNKHLSSYRNSKQDGTVYQNLLLHAYMKLNMFRATHRPSLGA